MNGNEGWQQTPEDAHGGAGTGKGSGSFTGGPGAGLSGLVHVWSTTGGKVVVIFSAVVTLAVGVAIGHFVSPAQKTTVITAGPKPALSAPASASVSAPGSAPALSASDSAGSTSAAATPAANTSVALASLTPLSGAFQSADTSPVLNGKPQAQALVQDIGCTATGNAQYNLGQTYTTLTALVGVDDNSPDGTVNPTVEIDGDGRQLGTFSPRLGHPAQINVNVAGVLRLGIKWTYQKPVTYPIPINCVPNAILVIGNGQLDLASGSQPSTP